MANNFCLPKEITKKFLQGLKSGDINPATLSDMSSAERRAFFETYVGKMDAQNVNTLFESKLLLKNQQQGMINWAKTVGSMKPAEYKTLVDKIRSLDTVLSPENERAFLEDIAAKKLGTEVTFDEAQNITKLSQEVASLKENVNTSLEDFVNGKETSSQYANRISYGKKVLEMHDYVETLNPIKKGIVANVLNLPKTVMSTLDMSAPLRQGWGMLGRKQFYKAFGQMFKYAASKRAFVDMQADIISRPTYQLMKKGQLRISSLAEKLSQREEQFMSNILSKIPGFGASERAYTGFLNKVRADVFDDLVRKAQLAGEDVSVQSSVIKDLASVVNDFTGSGHIGKGDRYANTVPILNATFFSPRKISATVNMFNPERYLNPAISKTARKAAIRQLISSVGITSTIIGLAGLAGAEITADPRSSDFGKVKIGNTRFDVTGGNGTYAVLLARLISNQSVSTTDGEVTDFGDGYKPKTRLNVTTKFIRNKLSPLASLIVTSMEGVDAMGNKIELPKEIKNRMMPLIISDTAELIKEDPAGVIPSTIASMFGIGVQRY